MPLPVPPKNIVEIFTTNGRSEDFAKRYVANAILSLIEEKEQQHIQNLDYDAWVKLSYKDICEKIIEYVNHFARAINSRGLSYDDVNHSELSEYIACVLYTFASEGIYEAHHSRYIIIRGEYDVNAIKDKLTNSFLEVRSRFIEIARNLVKVKQRFWNTSIYEAKPLIDRVFAYVEPRFLPIDVVDIYQILDALAERVKVLYEVFCGKLRKEENSQTKDFLGEVVKNFLQKVIKFRLYEYQVRGLIQILNNVKDCIDKCVERAVVLQAPTGSGKTEAFVLSIILASLAYKAALDWDNKSPAALIIYPRRALATDQLKRLITYLFHINNVLKDVGNRRKQKYAKLRLSINYTEIRPMREYEALAKKVQQEKPREWKEYKMNYIKVLSKYSNEGEVLVKLPFLWLPESDENPCIVVSSDSYIWYNQDMDFVTVTKEDVYEKPGDIHVTLFETLRNNLRNKRAHPIFGFPYEYGPFIIVLDEVHTYIGITGARYAYLLDRLLMVIKCRTNRHTRGVLFVCVSATVPNPENFIKKLLAVKEFAIVSPREAETIPLGNEYFYVIIPTTKYLVNHLAVSIQAAMVLHFNIPALIEEKGKKKKSFIFSDNLDVIERFRRDFGDAINRKLQDLRNPLDPAFYDKTIKEFGDGLCWKEALDKPWLLEYLKSWKEGEYWWPYALEKKEGLTFDKLSKYTGPEKGDVKESDIVVADSALELGVDYRDVVVIYQHGIPLSIASLIQRAGRSGRIVRDNPLVRVAVAVMLSPYIPSQAALFQLLIRSESLRNVLEYESLNIPVGNKKLIAQTIVESILDYMSLKPQHLMRFEDIEKRLLTFLNKEGRSIVQYIKDMLRRRAVMLKLEIDDVIKSTLDTLIEELKDAWEA
ncbi:MAG: DEAD/DEAH box helicase [archaeon GB-1867-005]|nr:DEAD/DEAH box helicase [Candidatus Culexmicrobium cathedralense]